MRSLAMAACAVMLCAPLGAGTADDTIIFRRGDANQSGVVDGSDVAFIGDYLFDGGPEPPCLNEADVDASGAVNITDMTYLSQWLFQGGSAPPAPGPYASSCTVTSPFISCDSITCP